MEMSDGVERRREREAAGRARAGLAQLILRMHIIGIQVSKPTISYDVISLAEKEL